MKKLLPALLALVLLASCAYASGLNDLLGILQGNQPTAAPGSQYPFSAYDLIKYAAISEVAPMDSCIIETRTDPAMRQVIFLCYSENDLSLTLRGTNPDGRQECASWEFVSRDAALRFIGLVLADFSTVQGCLPAGYTLRVDWPGHSITNAVQAASANLGQAGGIMAAYAGALTPLWPYDFTAGGSRIITGPTPVPPNPVPAELRCSQCDGWGRVQERCFSCRGEGEKDCSSCRGEGDYQCGACNGVGHYNCRSCWGDGCSSCGWDGDKDCTNCRGNGRKECGSCRGSGKDRCTYCSGRGYDEKSCSRCCGDGKID